MSENQEDQKMQVLVIEIDENSERMMDLRRYPAIESGSMHYGVYFIKDNKVVGLGKISSRYDYLVRVIPDWSDAETASYFAEDSMAKKAGESMRDYISFRFEEITGDYAGTYPDEPIDRGEGLRVVDRMSFDLGFASKLRFGEVEGFGRGRRR